MRSTTAFALALLGVASSARVALARDVPTRLFLDGRRVDGRSPSADLRDGKAYVDLARVVGVYSGLLTFGPAGKSRATIAGRTIEFTVGRRSAFLDGKRVDLPAAPFVRRGDTYVPLATIAKLTGSRLRVDSKTGIASLASGSGEIFPPTTPTEAAISDDDAPSVANALALVPSLVELPTGEIEGRLDATNRTDRAYTIAFAGATPVTFVVRRGGVVAWSWPAPGEGSGAAASITIEPHGVRRFAERFRPVPALAGHYVLRATLATAVPTIVSPASLDYAPPRTQ